MVHLFTAEPAQVRVPALVPPSFISISLNGATPVDVGLLFWNSDQSPVVPLSRPCTYASCGKVFFELLFSPTIKVFCFFLFFLRCRFHEEICLNAYIYFGEAKAPNTMLSFCCPFFLSILTPKSEFELFVGSMFALSWAVVHFKGVITVVPIKPRLIEPYLTSRRDRRLPSPTATSDPTSLTAVWRGILSGTRWGHLRKKKKKRKHFKEAQQYLSSPTYAIRFAISFIDSASFSVAVSRNCVKGNKKGLPDWVGRLPSTWL